MGGTNSGPQMNGSSLMGRGSARVSAPHSSGPSPRSTAARPMVAMITATTGRPMQRPQHHPLEPEAEADHARPARPRRPASSGAP